MPPQDFSVRAGRVPAAAAGVTARPSCARSLNALHMSAPMSPVGQPSDTPPGGAGIGEGPQDVTVKAGTPSRAAVVAAANADLDASRSQRAAEPAAVSQSAAPMHSSIFDRLVASPFGAVQIAGCRTPLQLENQDICRVAASQALP